MEEFAIDRLLGMDMYGIPVRPWYLAGYGCHAAGVDDFLSGCCAWEVCPPSPIAHSPTEFGAGLTWGEIAEVVEFYQHEHEHGEPEPVEPPIPEHSGDFGIPDQPEPPAGDEGDEPDEEDD